MIENYRNSLVGTVTFHPLEIKMMLKNRINRRTEKNKLKKGKTDKFLKILEDFVDDFIKIYQPQSEEHLLHLSQSLLHVIHTFFPPPSRKIYMVALTQYQKENWKRVRDCGEKGKEVLRWISDIAKR